MRPIESKRVSVPRPNWAGLTGSVGFTSRVKGALDSQREGTGIFAITSGDLLTVNDFHGRPLIQIVKLWLGRVSVSMG